MYAHQRINHSTNPQCGRYYYSRERESRAHDTKENQCAVPPRKDVLRTAVSSVMIGHPSYSAVAVTVVVRWVTEWGKVKGRAERGYVMWAKQVPNPIPLPLWRGLHQKQPTGSTRTRNQVCRARTLYGRRFRPSNVVGPLVDGGGLLW